MITIRAIIGSAVPVRPQLSIPVLYRAILFGAVLTIYVVFTLLLLHMTTLDYAAFMNTGRAYLEHHLTWGDAANSYYPLPMVMIFAAFASIPQPWSILLWSLVPVIVAVLIADWRILFFGPLFGHLSGGQSALFGMLGVWGYRRFNSTYLGGALLALCTLKPQLAIFPVVWAVKERNRKVWLGFLVTTTLLYLPSFLVRPGWVGEWLASSRGISERGMAGLVPRLLVILQVRGPLFWLCLLLAAALLIWSLRHRLTFRAWLLLSFVVNPLAMDYDLIQIIPVLKGRQVVLAVLLSIPTWAVEIFAWNSDRAWIVTCLIPLGLLIYNLMAGRREEFQPAASLCAVSQSAIAATDELNGPNELLDRS